MGKKAEQQMLQRIKEEQKKHHQLVTAARAEIAKGKQHARIERDKRKAELETMTKRQLLIAYLAVGGVSSDRSHTKEWLIDRILWKEFDAAAGYNLLRWGI